MSKNKKWGELAGLMGYQPIPGLASQLKNSYTKIILPFENYSDHVRSAPVPDATNPLTTEAPAAPPAQPELGSAPASPLSQLSEIPGEDTAMADAAAPAAKTFRPRKRMLGA